ncbi:MAG TPA: transposase, partial [Candidatus Flavonifractor merdigallinarum]|nr:transposase [Candidatus Flavonifractor merdigallinarum]
MSINEKICVPDKIKAELNAAISEAIARYKRDFEIKESLFPRKRILTVESLIKLLLSMEGGSLKKELHEAGIDVTASAFVQRRSQLSSVVMEQVLECFNRRCRDEKTYKGYRVLAVDGTTVNMARNEKAPTFVQNESNPRGYNQFHVNPLYDVLNKTYQHCIIQPQPKQDEVGALTFMLTWHDFSERTLIVADRGYESYNLFA